MNLSADSDACARSKSTLTQSNVTTQFFNGEMDGRIANVTNSKILSEGDELKQHVVTPDCILSGSSVLLDEVSGGEWSAENTVVCKNGSDSLSQVQKIKVNSGNNSSPIDSCRHHLFDLQGNNARLTPPPNSARKATRCLNDQFDSLTLDNNGTTNTHISKYEEKNDPTNDLVDSEISCATTAEITCSTTCGAAQESADHDQSNGTDESLELHQEEDNDFFDRKSCIVMAVRDPSAVVTHAGDFKSDMKNTKIPQALRLNLPQAMLNRITLYGLIHDINREATSMESEDFRQCGGSDVAGSSNNLKPKEEEFLIDEEQWLLSVISKRRTKEELVQVGALKTSLEQALGEEETDEVDESPSQKNAMAGVKCKEEVPNQIKTKFEASRTRLWKPSRSWWEARSGKNPWIEPKSHNKRWRYLWPMIHYHKFLTKSVKKLRRNGVDCRTSCSPVVVFLRDEVCGISEHLGEASKFSAEQWTSALEKFYGWSSKSNLQAAKMLGNIVARQATCALPNADSEGDDKSPLIKSQIDCSLLTSVVTGRQAGPKKKQNRSVSSGSLKKSKENRSQADTMSQSSCAYSDSQNTDYSIGQYYACLEDQNIYQGPTIMGYPPQYPHPSLGYGGHMSLQQDVPSQMHQQRKKNNQNGRNKRGFGKKGKHIPGTIIPNPDFRNIQNPDYFESMQQYPYYGVPCGIPLQHHLTAPHPVIHPHYDQWAHQGYSLDAASFQNPPVPSSPYQEQRPPTFPVSFGSPNYPPHMGGATDTPQSHRESGAPLHWSHLDQATLEMTGISSPGHGATPVRSRSSYNHVKQNSTPRQLLFNIPNHKSPDKMSPASKFLSSHVESADPFFGAQQHHARYHVPYVPPSTSGLPPRLHIQSTVKDGSRDSSVLTPKSNKKKISNRRKNRQCPPNS